MSMRPGTTHAPSSSITRSNPSSGRCDHAPVAHADRLEDRAARVGSDAAASEQRPRHQPARSRMRTTPASPSTSTRSPVLDDRRRQASTAHRWDAVLPRHDRGVRERAAGVAHAPGDLRERRRPVGRREDAHQDLSRLDLAEEVGRRDHSSATAHDTRRRRNAGELGCREVSGSDRVEQALVDAEDLLHDRVVGLGAGRAEHAGISARVAALAA